MPNENQMDKKIEFLYFYGISFFRSLSLSLLVEQNPWSIRACAFPKRDLNLGKRNKTEMKCK